MAILGSSSIYSELSFRARILSTSLSPFQLYPGLSAKREELLKWDYQNFYEPLKLIECRFSCQALVIIILLIIITIMENNWTVLNNFVRDC